MPTLILTPRFTEDAQALWRAANRLGWNVERLRSWEVPAALRQVPEPVLYLEALFGQTLAAQFGLRLLEPEIDWLPGLPDEYRQRRVMLTTLGACRELVEPAFIKPPNDKSFPARVYTGAELPHEYDEDTPVLVADVVEWETEFRCFILDRQLQTISIYLRSGELQRDRDFAATDVELAAAASFVSTILADDRVKLPRSAVVDVGVIARRGWAVVEQNADWGSGIYGCDPVRVLEVLRHAAVTI
ncbi:ATP-grasp domain-containing protein [Chamaesiphon sp. GL140_3_metabinner_50]|uniref:ATP-grasp domain-containing protein n=1 Tax=Chamaesiphon sp. GL140_3_metabinner_50 TaxID=2970812 RepID=UPI0025EDEB95|nr:ATP-grasp domain-containing protein [Chamaesiphon sp. GL140_3_metabinner_50]